MAYQPEPQPRWPDHTDHASADGTDGLVSASGSAGEVLGLCDEFFRSHASPAVHAELRRFLTDLGHHPVAGLGAFLNKLSFTALHADTGRPRGHEIRRAGAPKAPHPGPGRPKGRTSTPAPRYPVGKNNHKTDKPRCRTGKQAT
jgi:hypothetical protein